MWLDRLEFSETTFEGLELSFLQTRRLIPTRRAQDEIVVAVEDPDEADLAAIQRRTRLRPVPVLAAPEEIAETLDRLEGGVPLAASIVERLTPALTVLGVGALPEPPNVRLPLVQIAYRLVHSAWIGEDDLAAAFALAYGLPMLPSDGWGALPGCSVLMPEEQSAEHLAVPIAVIEGRLLLACAAPPPPEVSAAIQARTGLTTQLMIAPLSRIQEALARLAADADTTASTAGPSARSNGAARGSCEAPAPAGDGYSAGGALDFAVKKGRLTADMLARARLVAARDREPLEAVAVRLGLISQEELQQLGWAATGYETAEGESLSADSTLLPHLPAALARLLPALPLGSRGGRAGPAVRVALTDPGNVPVQQLLGAIFGATVVPVGVDRSQLREAIDRATPTSHGRTSQRSLGRRACSIRCRRYRRRCTAGRSRQVPAHSRPR